jgi:hypothetical protein
MTTAVELHIKNTGMTSARNVHLAFDQDYYFNAEEGTHNNIRNYTAFSKEIEMLAPGAELQFLLGVGHKIFSHPKLCPLQFTVVADYLHGDKIISERTTIDLEPFKKSGMPIDPIADRIGKLTDELRKVGEQIRPPSN